MSTFAELFRAPLPLIQAPMAGASGVALAVAVSEAGGVGSLPCALWSADQIRASVSAFRSRTQGPLNLNFFAHDPPAPDPVREATWQLRLQSYFNELGLNVGDLDSGPQRTPFSAALCDLVEELRVEIVSFHFGLPGPDLVARVRATGARIVSTATTLDEARFLEDHGCDAIIAQGLEAGGHRGMFLSRDVASQIGTMALVPLIADAVRAPVIAAGGIADQRGVAAAFALGACGVQVGTAFLLCPECETSAVHRAALARGGETALTNVLTGRPARGLVNRFMREVGPLIESAPSFPRAASFVAPLRARAEAQGRDDFSSLWAGQAFAMAQQKPARDVTKDLMGRTSDMWAAQR